MSEEEKKKPEAPQEQKDVPAASDSADGEAITREESEDQLPEPVKAEVPTEPPRASETLVPEENPLSSASGAAQAGEPVDPPHATEADSSSVDKEEAAPAQAPAESEPKPAPQVDAEREAKLKAAAEARAARAAAKAKAEAEAAEAALAEQATPKEPSPRQGDLERYIRMIEETIGVGTVQESGLNELNSDMPMLVIATERWSETGLLLREHEELRFNYLRNVSGIDYETHLEVVYFLLSMDTGQDVAIKLKADREAPSVPSATPIWSTANWNEREIYDLLGIQFVGHPDLRRIMMPDDWVGHPLRKDYEPLDSEV